MAISLGILTQHFQTNPYDFSQRYAACRAKLAEFTEACSTFAISGWCERGMWLIPLADPNIMVV